MSDQKPEALPAADFTTEAKIGMDAAAAHAGVHPSTMRRWAEEGCRGVRLETRRKGCRRQTSKEAVDRFFEALNAEPAAC